MHVFTKNYSNNICLKKPELPVDIHIIKDNAKTFTKKVDVKLTTSLYAGIFLTALNGCGL